MLSNANDTELASNIINIELKNHGVSKAFILSISVKKNPKLNPVNQRVNDHLCELCETNGFFFFNNDMIKTDHLWRDGIHLHDTGINILSRKFYQVLNNFLFEDHF